jgi:hypothetical protein
MHDSGFGRQEHSDAPRIDAYGVGSAGPPVALALRQTALTFPVEPIADAKAWGPHVGVALQGAGGALRRLAGAFADLAADEKGSRARSAEALARHAGEAGEAFAALAGRFAVGVDAEGELAITSAEADETAGPLFAFARRLIPMSPHPTVMDVYARGWSRAAAALRDFLRAAARPPDDGMTIGERIAQYNLTGSGVRSASLDVAFTLFAALPANRAIPAGARCAGCTNVGCTTYCYDEYTDPVGCSGWKLQSGAKYTYVNTCTWTVTSVQKDVCACYPGYWTRFWAYDACDQWVVERNTGTRAAKREAEAFSRWGPPTDDPTHIHVETSC